MLIRLGKWLRAAGYDTQIVLEPISDHQVLELAIKSNCWLLTRDRHFLTMKTPFPLVIYLRSNLLEECVHELGHYLFINWLHDPFSRCLICNSQLKKANEAMIQAVSATIKHADELCFCPVCQKMYWKGSHTQRMLKQLTFWQTGLQVTNDSNS